MKRKLAVLLALCLLMQCIGVTAFASDAEVTVEAAQAAVTAAEADAAQAAEAAAAAAQAAEEAKAEAEQKAAARDAAAGEADAAKQALETAQAGAAEAAAVAAAAQEALNAAKAEQEAAAQAAADAADAAAQKAAELEAAQGAAKAAKAEAESAANQAAELSAAAENAAAAKTAAEEALAAAQAAAAAEDATEEQQAAAGAAAEAAAQAAAQADAAAQRAAEAANAAGQKAEALTAAQQAADAAQQALDEAAAAKETAAAASDAAAKTAADAEAQAATAADAKSAADAAVADAQTAADEKTAALTAAADAADQAAAALTAAQDEAAQKAQASTDAAAALTAAQAALTEAQAAAEAAKEQNQEPENPQEDENENVTPADGDPEQNPDDPDQTPENPDENPDDPTANPEGQDGEGDSDEDPEQPAFAPHLVLIPAGKAIYEAKTCYTREGHELLEDAIAYAEEAADEEGLVWKVTYAAEGELKTGYVRAEDAGDAEPLEENGDAVAYGEIWLPNLKMNPTPDEVKKAEEAEEKAEDAEEKPETVEEKPETVEEKPVTVEEKPETVEEKPVTVEEKTEEAEKKEEPVEVKAEDAEKKADDAEKKTDEKADAKTDEKAALTEEEKAAAEAEALAAAADTDLLTEASESTDKDFYITPAGVITEYKGTATDIVIPVSVNGITVVGIAESAFKLNTKITSILLHQAVGLTYIEKGSFEGCTALKSVSLPNSIVDLDDYLFKGCTSLSAISWPDNLTYIGDHTFEGCTSLPAVVLPATVNYIGNSAFEGCTGIVKVALDNLTSIQIGSSAFRGCTKLAGIYLPNGVWDVGNAAFENCTAATVLSLPSNPSFTEIKNFTFKGCTGLKEIIIPSNVTVIGREAFANCSKVTLVDIPSGVTNIGSYAFNGLNSDVVFFVDTFSAVLGTDALGTSGTIIAWLGSTAYTYALNHKMTFLSMALVNYLRPFHQKLFGTNPSRTWLVSNTSALATGSITVGDLIGQMLADSKYINRNLSDSAAVKAIYEAMLGRAPSAVESGNALNAMADGVTIRYIANVIAGSDEFKNLCASYGVHPGVVIPLENRDRSYFVTAFVARAYRNILGRGYDVGGLNAWTGNLLDGGNTGADIMIGFVNSYEFTHAGLSNKEIVRRMYKTMLNREPDTTGWNAWTKQLDDGASVETIVAGFVGSFEFRGLCGQYGIQAGKVTLAQPRDKNLGVTSFVKRCYTEALGRGYDPEGLNGWCNVLLNQQETPAQVASGFVFSEESVLKGRNNEEFVKMLYRLYLGRTADSTGLNDWVKLLNNGMTRQMMVSMFASSIEFTKIVASYGLSN